MSEETINHVAKKTDGTVVMVLVEQGPWSGDEADNLRRVQDRIYNCVEAAISGGLAAAMPETSGAPVELRLDVLDAPLDLLTKLVQAISSYVGTDPNYQSEIRDSEHLQSLDFEVSSLP